MHYNLSQMPTYSLSHLLVERLRPWTRNIFIMLLLDMIIVTSKAPNLHLLAQHQILIFSYCLFTHSRSCYLYCETFLLLCHVNVRANWYLRGSSSPASQPSATSSSTMRGPLGRTYGKKKTAGTPAAAAVFGKANESLPLLQAQQVSPPSSRSRQASLRDPLVDITSVVENLTIAETSEFADAGVLATAAVENLSVDDNFPAVDASEVPWEDVSSADNDEPVTKQRWAAGTGDVPYDLGSLRELFDAYQQDRGQPLQMRSWAEIIDGELSIAKIAEASYAEVYRVTTEYGNSILKVMQLQVPSDPASMESYTTVAVKSIVAEMRIMNALTEIPGFVSFKDAHLVQGKPGTAISDAWAAYLRRYTDSDPDAPPRESYFPDPDSYLDQSVFLVIELGDAGEVLQRSRVNTRDKLFDIFLGITVALSRAEQESEFEVSKFS